jgi:hypothetical protein
MKNFPNSPLKKWDFSGSLTVRVSLAEIINVQVEVFKRPKIGGSIPYEK